tara:strand:- start:6490 stop:7461 length:972 start_codon:yes stop_codon:yes gene_type:complete
MKKILCLLPMNFLIAGCVGEQSMFSVAGEEAERTLLLTWILIIGSLTIFAFVIGCVVLAFVGSDRLKGWLRHNRMLIGGGIIFPVVTLSALLIYGFVALNAGPAGRNEEPDLTIKVVGEQWWWRVTYEGPEGSVVETANEIYLPTDRIVRLELTSADVIHSFWIPAWAGKVDMIPGRTNQLTLHVTTPRRVRGQCAEYCGGAHALMSFVAVALPPDEFEAWLEIEATGAAVISGEGLEAFLGAGCGGCHAIRGTSANGLIGPDLTHYGSRKTIAAATLPNTDENTLKWLKDHQSLKPDNLMPEFDFLSDAEMEAIALYLGGLR